MTIVAIYRWRRFSLRHQITIGDYLKFSISVRSLPPQVNNYTYTKLKDINSRPFLYMHPERFLKECQEFLSTFLSDIRALPLNVTNLIMPVIRNRFSFVLNPTAPSAPQEFKMCLAIALVEDGFDRVYVRDRTITEYDHEIQRTHRQGRVMVPASSEAILSLLKKSKIIKSDECMCHICMQDFLVSGNDDDNGEDAHDGDDANCTGEEGYSMPCGHMFHQQCILTWLLTSHMCPLCRYSLPTIEP